MRRRKTVGPSGTPLRAVLPEVLRPAEGVAVRRLGAPRDGCYRRYRRFFADPSRTHHQVEVGNAGRATGLDSILAARPGVQTFLKADIEGAKWRVLDQILAAGELRMRPTIPSRARSSCTSRAKPTPHGRSAAGELAQLRPNIGEVERHTDNPREAEQPDGLQVDRHRARPQDD